jgi:hypothetical protein
LELGILPCGAARNEIPGEAWPLFICSIKTLVHWQWTTKNIEQIFCSSPFQVVFIYLRFANYNCLEYIWNYFLS